ALRQALHGEVSIRGNAADDEAWLIDRRNDEPFGRTGAESYGDVAQVIDFCGVMLRHGFQLRCNDLAHRLFIAGNGGWLGQFSERAGNGLWLSGLRRIGLCGAALKKSGTEHDDPGNTKQKCLLHEASLWR